MLLGLEGWIWRRRRIEKRTRTVVDPILLWVSREGKRRRVCRVGVATALVGRQKGKSVIEEK